MSAVSRPGGWVPDIGWVARPCDLTVGDQILLPGLDTPIQLDAESYTDTYPVVVTRWTDGTVPYEPKLIKAAPIPESYSMNISAMAYMPNFPADSDMVILEFWEDGKVTWNTKSE